MLRMNDEPSHIDLGAYITAIYDSQNALLEELKRSNTLQERANALHLSALQAMKKTAENSAKLSSDVRVITWIIVVFTLLSLFGAVMTVVLIALS